VTFQRNLANGKPFTTGFVVGFMKRYGIGFSAVFFIDWTSWEKLTDRFGASMAASLGRIAQRQE
jgi:hypothetical protein